MFFLYRHLHDYPLHAGGLGCVCWGLPRHDRESCVSYEGSRFVRGVVLSAETRPRKGRAVEGSVRRISETSFPASKSRQGLERANTNVNRAWGLNVSPIFTLPHDRAAVEGAPLSLERGSKRYLFGGAAKSGEGAIAIRGQVARV
jgi:hypothetical protein